jgi:hypothetical protein
LPPERSRQWAEKISFTEVSGAAENYRAAENSRADNWPHKKRTSFLRQVVIH